MRKIYKSRRKWVYDSPMQGTMLKLPAINSHLTVVSYETTNKLGSAKVKGIFRPLCLDVEGN